MAKKVLVSIDLARNELQNARIHNLAADPSSPVLGQCYFNTSTNKFRTFNGSTWDEMGSSTPSAAGSTKQLQYNNGGAFGGASVYFDNATNQLGLGVAPSNASPFTSHRLQIADDNGANSDVLLKVGGGSSMSVNAAQSGGTIASPTTSALGAAAIAIRAWGYGTSAYKESAQIFIGTDDATNGGTTPTDTSMPGTIILKTTPVGSVTPTEALRVNNKQWVGLNNTDVRSRFDSDGSIGLAVTSKTASFTADATGHTYTCDATSGNITATLPTASTVPRRIYTFVKTDAGANTVTANSVVLGQQFAFVTVQSNGTSWVTIGSNSTGNLASWIAKSAPVGTVVGTSDTQTLTNKTLTTPTIGDFTNATHSHTTAAGGGQITDAALSSAVTVAKGGTGATTLTGVLKGNGTSAVTGSATLNDVGAATADYSINSHKLTNVLDPTAAQDAATKSYVDLSRQGLSVKDPVRAATTANGALASAFANGSVVDGVTLATGDRILLKNQTTASENGIYIVAATGAPTRSTDADATGELAAGTFVLVTAGTANAGNQFTVQSTTATPWVPASSGSTWVQLTGASTVSAGAGLTATGNVFAVGAGTGISVAADSVTVDRSTNGSTVPFKYIATIGDGTTTAIAVTHNLGTQDVIAQIRDATTNAVVECDITQTSTSVTTFTFAVAPALNAYKVVIIG